MNYAETLQFLYQQLPIYQRVGKTAFKKDLTNTLRLLDHLDHPHHRFPSIHIAGTNGKGSSAAVLESILRAAGYKVGLYTSPHLREFTERIKVGGAEIEQEEVVEFVDLMKPAIVDIQPSFFELTVAMAFWCFARKEVDIAVVETGLGGRLDSTNVLRPIASLITMIGWDHMDILGDTLEKIAKEKAGIIKKGVPVVVGADQPDLLPIFEQKAQAEGSPIVARRKEYAITLIDSDITHQVINVRRGDERFIDGLYVNNGARYLLENLPGVFDVLELLGDKGFVVDEEHMRRGLKQLEIRGRWQVLRKGPMVIADVSHNVSGLTRLFEQLAHEKGRKHIVFGMVKEKDIGELLELFPRDATYYWTQSGVPRSLSVDELGSVASSCGLKGSSFTNVNNAIADAVNSAASEDIIVVCGSTFVVAEIEGL